MSTPAAQLWLLIRPQVEEARRFLTDRTIRTALIVPWAEAFTSAFLLPIYPFFQKALQVEPVQMGQLRTVTLILNAASAPFAGWLLDVYGPFLGIALPASICAIGCLVRAFSTGFGGLFVAAVFSGLAGAKSDMAFAHLSRHTPPEGRTLAVTAAKVQLQLLTLAGTFCFTPLDALLTALFPEASFGLLRYRLEISLCIWGCGFGVLVLLFASDILSLRGVAPPTKEATRLSTQRLDRGAPPDERGACCSSPGSASPPEDDAPPTTPLVVVNQPPLSIFCSNVNGSCDMRLLGGQATAAIAAAQLGLFVAAAYKDTVGVTWPLFLQAHFGWAERQYGLLLPVQQALAFSLIVVPRIQERIGPRKFITLLGMGGSLSYAAAYALQSHTTLTVTSHLVLIFFGGVCIAGMEVVLVALSSRFAPPHVQGRLFAGMVIVKLSGSITGNLCGTRLFQASLDLPAGSSSFVGGGALPISLLTVLALIAVAALTATVARASAALEGPSTLS